MPLAGIPNLEVVDIAGFKAALGTWASGVTVITAATEDGPIGMAASSFSSVSLDPPLVMFCPAQSSSSWTQMRRADRFGVNILANDQAEVSNVFARPRERFSQIAWEPSAAGVPVIAGVAAYIECAFDAVHPAGDHDIVIGRITHVGVAGAADPLLYFRGKYGRFAAAE